MLVKLKSFINDGIFYEINKSQTKIVILELKLENLKNNENNTDANEIKKIEKKILEFYENQTEAARLR